MDKIIKCLLCNENKPSFVHKDNFRSYYKCKNCSLIFVPEEYHVSQENEYRRYKHHQNHPNDPKYRNFLSTLTDNLTPFLKPGYLGLDYGSGPTPTLPIILKELGYKMKTYDPYFASSQDALFASYDFITCSEVIEHFRNPQKEFNNFLKLIKKNGILAIMTQMYNPGIDFSTWRYKDDITHIAFYSYDTFKWLSHHLNVAVSFPEISIALFHL